MIEGPIEEVDAGGCAGSRGALMGTPKRQSVRTLAIARSIVPACRTHVFDGAAPRTTELARVPATRHAISR
jgi:hypothetical protein